MWRNIQPKYKKWVVLAVMFVAGAILESPEVWGLGLLLFFLVDYNTTDWKDGKTICRERFEKVAKGAAEESILFYQMDMPFLEKLYLWNDKKPISIQEYLEELSNTWRSCEDTEVKSFYGYYMGSYFMWHYDWERAEEWFTAIDREALHPNYQLAFYLRFLALLFWKKKIEYFWEITKEVEQKELLQGKTRAERIVYDTYQAFLQERAWERSIAVEQNADDVRKGELEVSFYEKMELQLIKVLELRKQKKKQEAEELLEECIKELEIDVDTLFESMEGAERNFMKTVMESMTPHWLFFVVRKLQEEATEV